MGMWRGGRPGRSPLQSLSGSVARRAHILPLPPAPSPLLWRGGARLRGACMEMVAFARAKLLFLFNETIFWLIPCTKCSSGQTLQVALWRAGLGFGRRASQGSRRLCGAAGDSQGRVDTDRQSPLQIGIWRAGLGFGRRASQGSRRLCGAAGDLVGRPYRLGFGGRGWDLGGGRAKGCVGCVARRANSVAKSPAPPSAPPAASRFRFGVAISEPK